MKKFVLLFMLMILALPAFSFEIDNTKSGKNERFISEIGFRLLNANKIQDRMIFVLKSGKQINAFTRYKDNQIVIYEEMIKYLQDEDELASILAHEISHGVDYRQGSFRGYFSYLSTGFSPRKHEYKADKRAIDYLVKAGYNPVAFIVVMNRIAPQQRYEFLSSHPLTSRRLANVYEYIYTKYPEYLVQNQYKDNIYYQNFLLTSRENRQKLEKKVKSNSKNSVKYL